MLSQQKRVKLLKSEGNRYQYVQRSFFFRFPDIIDVEFITHDKNQTALRIFSRSVYGHSDFGVNEKRIHTWLQYLKEGLVS